jgi:hypothetical protein
MYTITTESISRAYEERHGVIPSTEILEEIQDEVSGRLDNLLAMILDDILDDARNSQEVTA